MLRLERLFWKKHRFRRFSKTTVWDDHVRTKTFRADFFYILTQFCVSTLMYSHLKSTLKITVLQLFTVFAIFRKNNQSQRRPYFSTFYSKNDQQNVWFRKRSQKIDENKWTQNDSALCGKFRPYTSNIRKWPCELCSFSFIGSWSKCDGKGLWTDRK